MWQKKSWRDAANPAPAPIPTQIVSNEEYPPLPQTADQRRVEFRIAELAELYAGKLGMSRRDFLRTTGGMATGFLAMNEVFGSSFRVNAAEALDTAAYRELWPKPEFIFDAQTHHVKDSIVGPTVFRTLTARAGLNPDLEGIAPGPDTLHRANFVKEVFFDSDTVMAIMTGAVIGPPEHHALPTPDMVETRNRVNQAAGSRRMLSHGLADPTDPVFVPEGMEWQVRELGIEGWKCYTGNPAGPWRLDDREIAYPFFEKSLELGIKNISIHKGLPLPGRFESYFKPDDILQAARDFPDINFIIYHAGMKHMMAVLPAGESGVGADGYLPWTTDLVRIKQENPSINNIYPELGAVFGHSVITHPEICGHLLGQLVGAFGADHVIWGTDCIWWGSPQWLIEAFRRFEMPEKLQQQFGYSALTKIDKELIFGKNIAQLFDVDVAAALRAIPGDSLSAMRAAYRESGAEPSNTQYGWVAV